MEDPIIIVERKAARRRHAQLAKVLISAFIVLAGLPGLMLGKPDKKMGQRGTKTCDVMLENVRVPAANIIGGNPARASPLQDPIVRLLRLYEGTTQIQQIIIGRELVGRN